MPASRRKTVTAGAAGKTPLREEIADALERLARILMQRASDPLRVDPADGGQDPEEARTRELVRFLGQITSGWSQVPEVAFPATGAGFGSIIVVEDIDTGSVETCTLMIGPLLDFEAGQVSLASPIGQALLGVTEGELVEVQTPQRHRRLRVLSVRTLRDVLDSEPLRV